jgi:hypothetical protein
MGPSSQLHGALAREQTGQSRVTNYSDLNMTPCPFLVLIWLQWENHSSQKQDLKEKTVSRLRGLVLGRKPGGQNRKVALIIGHMSFRFPIDFMFVVLGPCESLRMLRELTMWLEQDFSLPFSLSISDSVVLIWLASPGEKTGAEHGVGGMKITSIVAVTI